MIALNVGCSVAMNWIQRIVTLSRTSLIANERSAETDNQRFFAAIGMTGKRS
jgi:hypothetical protein